MKTSRTAADQNHMTSQGTIVTCIHQRKSHAVMYTGTSVHSNSMKVNGHSPPQRPDNHILRLGALRMILRLKLDTIKGTSLVCHNRM